MIYFLIYLFLEVILTVEVASRIGGLMMFAEIMVSALLGIAILFNFRSTLILNIMELKERRINANGFYQRNLLSLLGAILLILPGILTDSIAVLIHIVLLGSLIVSRFMPKYPTSNQPHQPKDDNVIDAEIISDSPALR
ncbi:MAG: FxsA family protein [Epsilonproteobacteria bacterium]|nr:FxsA family protein [Campylobacterota bacterium]